MEHDHFVLLPGAASCSTREGRGRCPRLLRMQRAEWSRCGEGGGVSRETPIHQSQGWGPPDTQLPAPPSAKNAKERDSVCVLDFQRFHGKRAVFMARRAPFVLRGTRHQSRHHYQRLVSARAPDPSQSRLNDESARRLDVSRATLLLLAAGVRVRCEVGCRAWSEYADRHQSALIHSLHRNLPGPNIRTLCCMSTPTRRRPHVVGSRFPVKPSTHEIQRRREAYRGESLPLDLLKQRCSTGNVDRHPSDVRI